MFSPKYASSAAPPPSPTPIPAQTDLEASPSPFPAINPAHIHACGPWTAGRVFSVVPPFPLTAIEDYTDEQWYCITRGRFIGVTNVHALEQAAIIRVSGAAHKGYTTQAAAVRAFNNALLYDASIYPAMQVERAVVLYPWGTRLRQTAAFHFTADDVTLRDLKSLEVNLYASPGHCDICPKPHFRHAALPGVSFTILAACPHHPDVVGVTDDFWRLSPNKAVAHLLPEGLKHQTCVGNLVVIKHAHPDGGLIANQGLPVLDICESEIPYVDELVRRWAPRLHGLRNPSPVTDGSEDCAPAI
ncbi:hypothetical protein C8R47DRAFT_1230234 [Mycena vitilis]|nr:hypothetical protein C8R47DRAFT_1230234 [Mycena vitilis]